MTSPVALPASPASSATSGTRFVEDPLASVLCCVAGGALVGASDELGGARRGLATIAGLALIGVAAFRPLSSLLVDAGTRRRAAELRLAFVVDLPVERVFAFCRDFENFPRFIGALRSVRDYGDGRSRWCASTPGGEEVVWQAVTTKYVPNRVIAWETTAGAPVRANGLLRFKPEDGRTCLELRLAWSFEGTGTLRDSLAALVTPRREGQLAADVRRMIEYLESAPEAELQAYGL